MRWPVLALALAALVATQAVGDFAGVAGFSGRRGADCSACHAASPLDNPATAVLEGLPDAWQHDTVYTLDIRVLGGPEAVPHGAPQGGFELETSAGRLVVPDGAEDLLRPAYPTVMTYRPNGTLMRDWQVEWHSPSLGQQPGPVGFWLAVLSANGNHVMATNTSDAGERGDVAAALSVEVPASPATWQAWHALPLQAPVVDGQGSTVPRVIKGHHADGNATGIAWSLDGGTWTDRETGAAWWVQLTDLEPGTHELRVRSTGAGRTSPDVVVTIDVEGGLFQGAPAPFAILPLAFAAVLRRHP